MEVVLLIVVVVLALLILGRFSGSRRVGDAADAEMRAIAPGASVDRQFKRPPNEGGLL